MHFHSPCSAQGLPLLCFSRSIVASGTQPPRSTALMPSGTSGALRRSKSHSDGLSRQVHAAEIAGSAKAMCLVVESESRLAALHLQSERECRSFVSAMDKERAEGKHMRSWPGINAHGERKEKHSMSFSGRSGRSKRTQSGFIDSVFAFLRRMRGANLSANPLCSGQKQSGDQLDLHVATHTAPGPHPSPMLDLMPENSRMQCIARMTSLSFKEDEKIVKRGEIGDTLFVIVNGSAKASLGGKQLQILGKGSFFGEISFLATCWKQLSPKLQRTPRALGQACGQRRQCDVIAVEDTQCLLLAASDFLAVVNGNPSENIELIQGLAAAAAERLARVTQAQEGDDEAECTGPGNGSNCYHIRPPRHVSRVLSHCLLGQLAALGE